MVVGRVGPGVALRHAQFRQAGGGGLGRHHRPFARIERQGLAGDALTTQGGADERGRSLGALMSCPMRCSVQSARRRDRADA